MRYLAVISLVVATLGVGGVGGIGVAAAEGPRSPWPDPQERAAFQRQELERRAALYDVLRRPATARTALQDNYDVSYYRLKLDMRVVDAEWIVGDLEAHLVVTADDLDRILFDLHDTMQVDSVFVDGISAAFTHEGYDLEINPGAPLQAGQSVAVRVFYQGRPAESGESFGWDEHAGTALIWTLSEPNGAREWWPCKDRPHDKADSLDVILRVDDWMVATSNGLLVDERDEGDGSKTYHWKHRYPISTYLVSVTATNYERIEDEYVTDGGERMLIEHFVFPEQVRAARYDLSITPEAIAIFSDRFGPYPFLTEKYGHSVFLWGGAMEHQTNTSYGSYLIQGSHTFDWILVHELAHQWWGDMVSPADWRDVWLSEGFASFSEALWFEADGGFEDYRLFMVNIQQVEDPSGPLYDPTDLFDGNTVYNKGAWVVHMLRGALGDSLFYAALAEYRDRTAYRSTTTDEFQSIVEEVADRDMDWFFGPWVYGVDRPEYSVSFLPLSELGLPSVAIHLTQTQETGIYFSMPVDLQISLAGGGVYRARVWNDPDHQDYEVDLPVEAVGIRVDPNDWILKKVALDNRYRMHITTTDLPVGVQDSLYEVTLRGRGGDPPYEWAVADSLPDGMELNPSTGMLRGFCPPEGIYTFTVELLDARNHEDTQRFEWAVTAVPDTSVIVIPQLSFKVGPVPANRYAWFRVDVPVRVDAKLDIYDLDGRRVRQLWDGPVPSRPISWDGLNDQGNKVASGVYVARLVSGGRTQTHRVVWLWKT